MSVRVYRPEDEAVAFNIMRAALEAGELPGTTLHDIETVCSRLAIDPESKFIVLNADSGMIAGFMSPMHQILVVRPEHRRRGHGTRLVAAALERARSQGEATLDLAVPLGHADAEAFARNLKLTYRSSLWLFGLPTTVAVAPSSFPAGFTTRTIQPEDEAEYAALFNRAFADHASPIQVSPEIIRHVHSLPEFDPTTILLLFPPDTTTPIGFCRISLHEARGEVEFVGVSPERRGLGLGRELLRWGIGELRSRGAATIYLSVEAENELALGLYERTGFERVQEWPRWQRST